MKKVAITITHHCLLGLPDSVDNHASPHPFPSASGAHLYCSFHECSLFPSVSDFELQNKSADLGGAGSLQLPHSAIPS